MLYIYNRSTPDLNPPPPPSAAVNQVSIGWNNGLSPIRRGAIIWTNSVLLSRSKLQWNCVQNTLFILENASESIVCEITAILSTGRWVDKEDALNNCFCYALITIATILVGIVLDSIVWFIDKISKNTLPYFSFLHDLGHHDDPVDLVLPYHPPHILHSVNTGAWLWKCINITI